MKVPAVTHASVLEPHVQRTLRLLHRQRGVVLLLHDGSELDYSGLTSLADRLGQIGNGHGRGYEGLNSLAVLPQGRAVLGLVSQILHCRPRVPKDETPAQRAARQSRESLLWLKAVDSVAGASRRCRRELGLDPERLPEGLRVGDVADRNSDPFESLGHEDLLGSKYVLRSQHNRSLRVGPQGCGTEALLHDHLRGLPEQGRRALELADEEWVEVLSGWRYKERRPLTVREFFLALARLGGHQNRKCDGQPGWLVLWRGWIDLQRRVAGAQAARRPKAAPRQPAPAAPQHPRGEAPDTG
jgi:hypothetical protein